MNQPVDLTELKRLLAEAERAAPNDPAPRLKFHGAVLRDAPAMIEELERLRSEVARLTDIDALLIQVQHENEALRKDAKCWNDHLAEQERLRREEDALMERRGDPYYFEYCNHLACAWDHTPQACNCDRCIKYRQRHNMPDPFTAIAEEKR